MSRMRGLRRNLEMGEQGAVAALPFIGITPAPASINKTEAETLIDEFRTARIPKGSRTTEVFEWGRLAAKLTNELRKQNPEAGTMIEEAFGKGEITAAQVS